MIRLLIVSILVCITLIAEAQNKRKKSNDENNLQGVPLKERIVTGGGFGLAFGSTQDFISLSPMVGYKITEKFIAGTSITYRYTKYKYYNPAIKLTDYGLGPFLRYTIFNNVFIQTEYEYLNYEFPTGPEQTTRKAFSSFLAGGGFIQPIGDKAAFYVSALYNFSYREPRPGEYSPYYSPLILRAGITLGF